MVVVLVTQKWHSPIKGYIIVHRCHLQKKHVWHAEHVLCADVPPVLDEGGDHQVVLEPQNQPQAKHPLCGVPVTGVPMGTRLGVRFCPSPMCEMKPARLQERDAFDNI